MSIYSSNELAAPLCPCCTQPMRDEPGDNATSRYRNVVICSACGVREAFEGDFWTELFHKHKSAILLNDRTWRRAHDLANIVKE